MNGKQAKRLRRAALGMAVHMVETGRTVREGNEHSKPQKPHPVDQEEAPKRSETEINRPDTLRGIYRYLKKTNDPQK